MRAVHTVRSQSLRGTILSFLCPPPPPALPQHSPQGCMGLVCGER